MVWDGINSERGGKRVMAADILFELVRISSLSIHGLLMELYIRALYQHGVKPEVLDPTLVVSLTIIGTYSSHSWPKIIGLA